MEGSAFGVIQRLQWYFIAEVDKGKDLIALGCQVENIKPCVCSQSAAGIILFLQVLYYFNMPVVGRVQEWGKALGVLPVEPASYFLFLNSGVETHFLIFRLFPAFEIVFGVLDINFDDVEIVLKCPLVNDCVLIFILEFDEVDFGVVDQEFIESFRISALEEERTNSFVDLNLHGIINYYAITLQQS